MAIKVDKAKCTGCGLCVDICPVKAIKVENAKAVIDDNCVECSACLSQCPQEAIFLEN